MANNIWNPLEQTQRRWLRPSVAFAEWQDALEARRAACKQYAYAVPSAEIGLELLRRGLTRLVEMGAGTGYWKRFLEENYPPLAVAAFDCEPYQNRYTDGNHAPVFRGSSEILALSDYARHALLLVWPPYADSMAYDCLKVYQGDTLIYVGEGSGGWTGDDAFHALLEAEWEQVWCNHRCANWPGIHSHEMIYRRIG